ncbi:MAG TPA: DUF4175 family protein, partial [Verrucomicrobiae bacterium]|nr:DUF4175 family protein [Verrucomicrobiae bacterium]
AAEYLSGERQPSQEYEHELASALEQRAGRDLQKIEVPYWNRPLRPALLLGALALVAILFVIVASGGFTAFERAALPWANAAYTQVRVQPGDIEIPVGKDVEIKSTFLGRIPVQPQFQWQEEGNARWEFATLTRNETGEYNYPIKGVQKALHYRVSGSDAVSPEFKLQTYVPPEVKEWRVELDYPSYTKHAPSVQASPEITVVRGSTAKIQITPSVKLAKARVRFNGLPPMDLRPSDNGLWQGDLKINKDTDYWVELADEKGHAGGNETAYHIKALPDAPPKVEIPEPGQDLRAEATNTVPVKISMTDDFGLQEVKLIYHRLGGPEQAVTARRDGETNSQFTAEIPLAPLGLKENELVAFHAEARDNNTLDGPGVGKSAVFFVEVTNEEGSKSKSQAQGQRVNLLVIQKQIIADTTALEAKASTEKFDELGKRQLDAADFGRLYLKSISVMGPTDAATEMQAAVNDMEKARGWLEQHTRDIAVPSEEDALAHLYQVLKKMPELQDLPTMPQMAKKKTNQPPVLQVVLDAIKKQKKEEPNNKELADALQQAEQMREQQASLTIGSQNSGSGSGQGEVQMVRASNPSDSQSKPQPANGEAKANEAKAGKAGEGKGNNPGENAKPGEDGEKLAEKENTLSKEARELADKLARLAGKDARLGHSAAKKMNDAAAKMDEAAKAMAAGNMQKAGTKGSESGQSLDAAIALLDAIVNNRPEKRDVSKEDFPKEYETVIAEYLKKLSYEE